MSKYKIWIKTHHDGEDPNQFSANIEAPTLAAAMERAKRTAVGLIVSGWQHFDDIIPAWLWWWPDGEEDLKETMFVTAQKMP